MPLIVANWKMYKTLEEAKSYCKEINKCKKQLVICPPYVFLTEMRKLLNKNIMLGAQNCAAKEEGPYTGEVSAKMLKNLCEYVIIGHSERRQHFDESAQNINKKVQAAQKNKLNVIYCIGETLNQKLQKKTEKVIEKQLREGLLGCGKENIIIAYEPVWAIGTGRTPELKEIETTHRYIKVFCRSHFGMEFPVIYGGSIDSDNSKKILSLENVDGVLVGGSSLDPKEFKKIVESAKE